MEETRVTSKVRTCPTQSQSMPVPYSTYACIMDLVELPGGKVGFGAVPVPRGSCLGQVPTKFWLPEQQLFWRWTSDSLRVLVQGRFFIFF